MIPKYRAWDKRTKRILQVESLYFDLTGNNELYEVQCTEKDGYPVTFEPRDVELLQWTTRKDKNKNDIYTGHILKIPYTYYDRIDWAIKVPYKECILGIVAFSEKTASFGVIIPEDVEDLSKGFNSFEMLFDVLGVECEIIGDKFNDKHLVDWFENPELLEEAKTK